MKAVILAGGKGTRLGDLAGEYPKLMMIIGSKPLIEHQIELLKRYEVNDIFILVNHLKDKIKEYIGDGHKYNVKITYYEEKEPLGTVGGIKEIEEYLKEDFLVLYGDVMICMDLNRFINFHKEKRSDCTLVLHPNNHPYDSDLVDIDKQGRIIAFYPKPHDENKNYRNLVSAGVYILSPLIFGYIKKGVKSDFGRNIFPDIYKKISLYGYNTAEYLKDMGTPERLQEVRSDYLSNKVSKLNYENKRRAIFMDRDGVLNREKNFISKVEDLELFDFTADAIKTINSTDFLALIVTNQSAVARNLCSIEDIDRIHNKLETELGKKGAKLDAIYYCPHHPDKGFPEENKEYKIDCDCRKPKLGMFKQACKEHNIDAAASYMIGDTERDILFGKNAGMETIGVMTGYGLKAMDNGELTVNNYQLSIKPDYIFRDLLESVNFIVKDPYREYFENIYGAIENGEWRIENGELTNSTNLKKPYIINIGGNTRTGKSNFTNYLKNNLVRKGLKVLVIELDKWKSIRNYELGIRNKNQKISRKDAKTQNIITQELGIRNKNQKISRKDAKTQNIITQELGIKNYRSEIVIEDLYKLLKLREKIQVADSEGQPIEYKYNDEDVIIIEGVIALSFEEIRNYSNLKIFFETDSDSLKKRIYEYYKWKGEQDNYIEELYKQRNKDEYQIIEKDSIFADVIVCSS